MQASGNPNPCTRLMSGRSGGGRRGKTIGHLVDPLTGSRRRGGGGGGGSGQKAARAPIKNDRKRSKTVSNDASMAPTALRGNGSLRMMNFLKEKQRARQLLIQKGIRDPSALNSLSNKAVSLVKQKKRRDSLPGQNGNPDQGRIPYDTLGNLPISSLRDQGLSRLPYNRKVWYISTEFTPNSFVAGKCIISLEAQNYPQEVTAFRWDLTILSLGTSTLPADTRFGCAVQYHKNSVINPVINLPLISGASIQDFSPPDMDLILFKTGYFNSNTTKMQIQDKQAINRCYHVEISDQLLFIIDAKDTGGAPPDVRVTGTIEYYTYVL